MAPWTSCTRRWSCCSGGTACGPTCCSAAEISRPCATRRTCAAWRCRPSIATCRASIGERGAARPGPARPGPTRPRRRSCRVPAGTTPARRRPRSSPSSSAATTRLPTTCRSCPTAAGWRPTSTTWVGSAGSRPGSLPCPLSRPRCDEARSPLP